MAAALPGDPVARRRGVYRQRNVRPNLGRRAAPRPALTRGHTSRSVGYRRACLPPTAVIRDRYSHCALRLFRPCATTRTESACGDGTAARPYPAIQSMTHRCADRRPPRSSRLSLFHRRHRGQLKVLTCAPLSRHHVMGTIQRCPLAAQGRASCCFDESQACVRRARALRLVTASV